MDCVGKGDGSGKPGDFATDAVGEAGMFGQYDMVALLERYKENPEEIRRAMRVEVGWYDEAAAEMFALVVFVSDGLLKTNHPLQRQRGGLQVPGQDDLRAAVTHIPVTSLPSFFVLLLHNGNLNTIMLIILVSYLFF